MKEAEVGRSLGERERKRNMTGVLCTIYCGFQRGLGLFFVRRLRLIPHGKEDYGNMILTLYLFNIDGLGLDLVFHD